MTNDSTFACSLCKQQWWILWTFYFLWKKPIFFLKKNSTLKNALTKCEIIISQSIYNLCTLLFFPFVSFSVQFFFTAFKVVYTSFYPNTRQIYTQAFCISQKKNLCTVTHCTIEILTYLFSVVLFISEAHGISPASSTKACVHVRRDGIVCSNLSSQHYMFTFVSRNVILLFDFWRTESRSDVNCSCSLAHWIRYSLYFCRSLRLWEYGRAITGGA